MFSRGKEVPTPIITEGTRVLIHVTDEKTGVHGIDVALSINKKADVHLVNVIAVPESEPLDIDKLSVQMEREKMMNPIQLRAAKYNNRIPDDKADVLQGRNEEVVFADAARELDSEVAILVSEHRDEREDVVSKRDMQLLKGLPNSTVMYVKMPQENGIVNRVLSTRLHIRRR